MRRGYVGWRTTLVHTINLQGKDPVSSMNEVPGTCSPLYSSRMYASILGTKPGPKTLYKALKGHTLESSEYFVKRRFLN